MDLLLSYTKRDILLKDWLINRIQRLSSKAQISEV